MKKVYQSVNQVMYLDHVYLAVWWSSIHIDCVSSFLICLQNTPVGRSVFMVNATDPDQGTGGSVLFSFQPPSPFFAIDGARGIVTVIRALDYEAISAFQLTVNATVSTCTTQAFYKADHLASLCTCTSQWREHATCVFTIINAHPHPNAPQLHMGMCELLTFVCFYQDQDKTRPLSRLANLAITITDVQDMDPIFTNLPYSTNIEEDVPLVSVMMPHCYISCRLPVICTFLSYTPFSAANMFLLYFSSLQISGSSSPAVILSVIIQSVFGAGARQIWWKEEVWVIRRVGCLTFHRPSLDSPPPRNSHTLPQVSPQGPAIQDCRCLRL